MMFRPGVVRENTRRSAENVALGKIGVRANSRPKVTIMVTFHRSQESLFRRMIILENY